MQGGTFQSAISFWVSFLGGERSKGGGGDPAPLGSFLCLCMGGASGSSCIVSILATLCLLNPSSPLAVNLTISEVVFPSFWMLVPKAVSFFTPKISSIFYLADLIDFCEASAVGFCSSLESTYLFLKLCATSLCFLG